MSDDSPESLGDDPTYVGKGREREDQSLGDQSTYAGSNESSLGDLDGLGGSLEDGLDGLEIVDLESRYTIIRPIGKGGMGEVFLATDTRLNRKVAIKRIKDELTTPAAAARFLTEAKSIAALSHPYIVQVYDYGRAKDGPFLIMEYVEGENLQQVCNQGVMALEDAIDLACKLCDALGTAHSQGIIHRDIKPANILMTSGGWPKISDFGLAKSTSDHGHTITGTALGTLDFMPPEQRRDASAVDHRSDLWSLAATIYQMVTGEPPKVIDLEEVPPVLRTVLGKALKTQPDKRYQNVKSLKDDIEQCYSSDTLPIGQLNIGECPNCNTRNESNRKYCRECAASLLVDCLECGESIAVWDKICGECGNNQEEALKAKRSEYMRLKGQAEGLSLSHRYQEAIELANRIGENYHRYPLGADLWAEEFSEATKLIENESLNKVIEIFEAAQKARACYDYRTALKMIDEIPEPLLTGDLMNFSTRTEQERKRVSALEQRVDKHLKQNEYSSLLPIVEELLELQPNRSSVKRLHSRAIKLNKDLLEERARSYKALKAIFDSGDFEQCLREIEKLPARYSTAEVEELRHDAVLKDHELLELADQIKSLFEVKNYNQSLSLIKRYLEINPRSKKMLGMRAECELHSERIAAEVSAVLNEAEELKKENKYDLALVLLKSVHGIANNNQQYKDLKIQCRCLSEERKLCFASFDKKISALFPFSEAGRNIKSYQKSLMRECLFDQDCSKLNQQRRSHQIAAVFGVLSLCVVPFLLFKLL